MQTELPIIGNACKGFVSCEDVIRTGIDYGLTSMGIPPCLPNWNQLKNQGMDYLAAEVASEIASETGLPEELAKLGVDEAMTVAQGMAYNTIAAMTANRGTENGPQYDWVLPFTGMDPAVWIIWLRKNGTVELPSNLFILTMTNGLYIPGKVHVPRVFPSSNIIKIPIVLQPDYSKIPPPLCQYGLVGNTCTPTTLFKKPVCQVEDYDWTTHSWKWVTFDCLPSDNNIDIYYRDYWVNNHLNSALA